MRLITLILLTSAMSGGALAQTPECRTIAEPATRLACYDKATPPLAAATAPKRPTAPKSQADPEKSTDSQTAEDAMVTARMNGICRGC
jgi:type VI secretion system VasI family protein